MRLFATFLLASALSLSAAITEKYVSSAGGGAHDGSTEADAFSWAEMLTDINAGGKAGNRYNLKGNVARTTTADNITGGGTSTSPVIIRGYTTTIGDGYQGRSTSGSGALVTSNMPVVSYTSGSLTYSGSYAILESISWTSTRNSIAFTLSGGEILSRACSWSNAASGSSSVTVSMSGVTVQMHNSDLALSNGGNAGSTCLTYSAASLQTVSGCRLTSSALGMNGSGVILLYGNVFYNCALTAFTNSSTASPVVLIKNTFVGNTTDAVGIITGRTTVVVALNNCITDNGGIGLHFADDAFAVLIGFDRFRANTGGDISGATDWLAATGYGNVTSGASSDYVNAGTGDYRLISTSPAVGMGFPVFLDAGYWQSQAGTGAKSYTFGQ